MNFEQEMFVKMVLEERRRQDNKWGKDQKEIPLKDMALYITEELGEFVREVNEEDHFKSLIELIETAALCMKAIETSYCFHDTEILEKALQYLSDRADNQKGVK